jgi:4a-hydroxytetrahydrobiopterin dehydratase
MDLSQSTCKPCEGGIAPLNKQDIASFMKKIHADWRNVDDQMISREFSFVNYRHTIDFVNRMANLAEEEGHHPVLHVFYARIVVELWTHAIGGLSENDFIMAAKIDVL